MALTLGLGLGATTAVFRLVDAVLLHPLPIPEADRVVAVSVGSAAEEGSGFSFMAFRSMEQRTRSLASVAGYTTVTVGVRTPAGSAQVIAAAASGTYFSVLKQQPQIGRFFATDEDAAPGAHPVVVLSDAIWGRDFHRSPSAIGQTIHLGGNPFTIIGVAAPGFRGTRLTNQPDLWVPLTMVTSIGIGGLFAERNTGMVFTRLEAFGWIQLVGRLRDAVEIRGATAELNDLYATYRREHSLNNPAVAASNKAPIVRLHPITEAATLGERVNLVRFMAMLFAVVSATLLIACLNVANMLLVRTIERGAEFAIRTALGAAPARLMGQVLLESVLLVALGMVAAIAIGATTMKVLSTFTLPGGIRLDQISYGLDARVALFSIGLVVATALLVGLLPARQASAPAFGALLKARGTASAASPRGFLIGAQVALSLVLLVSATLFVRSLRAGLATDLGFDPRPVAAVSVDPSLYGYDRFRAEQYYDRAMQLASALPGVSGVATALHVPLAEVRTFSIAQFSGGHPASSTTAVNVGLNAVTPDYFRVLGVPVVQGRRFTSQDDAAAPKVTVINQAAAALFFPNETPIGKDLAMLTDHFTVVGVVRDSKYGSVQESNVPVVFHAMAQDPGLGNVSIIVRSASPAVTLGELRKVLQPLDPNMPLHDGRLLTDQIDLALMPQRFGATLFSMFALIALAVATVGTYAIITHTVSRRAGEIGVRIALGAQASDILRTVLMRTGRAVGLGLIVGVFGSALASRAFSRFLYGVQPMDSASFAVALFLLTAATVAGTVIPARRAVRTDPTAAMRAE